MRTAKLAVVPAILLLGLAGCGESSGDTAASAPTAAATTTAPADPAQRLKASTTEIEAGNYRFTFKSDLVTGTGYVHKPSQGSTLDLAYKGPDGNVSAQLRKAADATLARIVVDDKPVAGDGKWLKLDPAKTAESELLAYIGDADTPGAAEILATATDVVETRGDLTGMVDLAKPQGVPALDENTLAAIANSVHRVPFVATVDDQGRLTKLVLDLVAPSAGRLYPIELNYSDYGQVTPEAAPAAGEIVPAPASFYDQI
ncbi:hypothetical protein O7635_15535 [Asanoa sp. WMMD1127]|uniref:hypothetical protein n=1 Tax=Asanoa sp. WMMD1127 TaxID=3016107 RepID=UPI0024170D4A|nr:hypothetical protein [Asanoa sp. WMMD1127]MDG4823268.1 hypothetical protein [Asanoa sp. WMMD1127]